MQVRGLSRWQAAGLHLSVSVCVAAVVGALLYFLWFPQPWFVAAGASTLILLLMGVDVCIGPLLTAIAFNPRKSRRELRVDLGVIVLAQTIAFAYGLHVIEDARPVFIVAAVDRYVLVAADQLDDADLAKGSKPQFRHRSWTGPVLVGAILPPDGDTLQHALNVLAGGKDIDRLPQYYVPYVRVAEALMQRARPLSALKLRDDDEKAQITRIEREAHRRGQDLRYLPVQRRDADYTAIVNPKTQQPVIVLDINPWPQ